jgi:replicative DNA helicase
MLIDERSENVILASILFCHDDDVCKGVAYQAVAGLNEKSFSSNGRRDIFNAINKCLGAHSTPDSVNVSSCVSDDGLSALYGLSSHATTNDISSFVKKLQDSERARDIELFSVGIQNRLSFSEDLAQELQSISSEMMRLASSTGRKISDEGFMSDFCGKWFSEKEKQMQTGETGFMFSGVKSIDYAIGGFRAGDTVVIAGRTGMGKSSLAMTMITNQIVQGFKIALFSLELGRVEIFDKAVSMLSDLDSSGECVPFRTIHNPAGAFGGVAISQTQLNRVSDIVGKYMMNTRFYARGTGRVTIEEIMSTTRKLVHDGECDAIYIDHIGLLVKDKNKEREELTHITNSLRIFAGEVGIPVFEVVQMNRSADTTKEKPKGSSMKGSGSIEEDASVILMPWRPYAIDKEKYKPEESEIIVAKGRNGGEGIIATYFCPRTTRFYELDTANNYNEQNEGDRF